MKVLQIGLGGFGKKHLATWYALGLGDSVYVAELSPELLAAHTKPYAMPASRAGTDYKKFLPLVDAVDIVTPATTHAHFIAEALAAGKHVFVEKPMTMTAAEAKTVVQQVAKSNGVLQIGFHYRYHAFTAEAKRMIAAGELGDIRYISGNFKGFKRPRTDVGVTHSDAIHFFDVINYLLDAFPATVHATMRDYFPRGTAVRMDDLSITTLTYPKDILVKIEAGYVQIAEGTDPAVPGALADQSLEISGTKGMLRIDYLGRKFIHYKTEHVHEAGAWKGINNGALVKNVPARDAIELEFEAFLRDAQAKHTPLANAEDSGFKLACIIEAVYKSAASQETVSINYK